MGEQVAPIADGFIIRLMKTNGAVWLATRLESPTNWSRLFGRQAELFVEIGFGGGEFLLDLAKRHPNANILGIEISNPSLRKAEKKIKNRHLTNVQLAMGDARAILWLNCAPNELSRTYINFPDPWHKAGHVNRRLIDAQFLSLLAARMPAGGKLEIATDHPHYQQWIAERLAESPYFDSSIGVPFKTDDPDRYRTKYELQALAAGSQCRYFKTVRNQTSAQNIFPIPPEAAMPHLVLHLPLSADQICDRFESGQSHIGTTSVRLINLFRAAQRDTLLAECFVSEEPQNQRVGLSIQKRDEDKWIISLGEIGFPRPTAGIHAAVFFVGRWITSLHPKGQIVRHNLNLPKPQPSSTDSEMTEP